MYKLIKSPLNSWDHIGMPSKLTKMPLIFVCKISHVRVWTGQELLWPKPQIVACGNQLARRNASSWLLLQYVLQWWHTQPSRRSAAPVVHHLWLRLLMQLQPVFHLLISGCTQHSTSSVQEQWRVSLTFWIIKNHYLCVYIMTKQVKMCGKNTDEIFMTANQPSFS